MRAPQALLGHCSGFNFSVPVTSQPHVPPGVTPSATPVSCLWGQVVNPSCKKNLSAREISIYVSATFYLLLHLFYDHIFDGKCVQEGEFLCVGAGSLYDHERVCL